MTVCKPAPSAAIFGGSLPIPPDRRAHQVLKEFDTGSEAKEAGYMRNGHVEIELAGRHIDSVMDTLDGYLLG